MGTEIKFWQISNGKLTAISTNLRNEGRTEPYDLEPWLQSNPSVLGADIALIGRQVMTKSGPIDLLAIDRSGNMVIIEIKREKLPREVLAQAIDYASDVAEWGVDKIGEICSQHNHKPLIEFIGEAFPDADVESINVNEAQRIVLVGFSVESSLERMIEWLSDNYSVNINAVILNYVRTAAGDELLAKTTVISEEAEQERVKKQRKFVIPMSDEPGNYDQEALQKLLLDYLSRQGVTNQRIRAVLLPFLLRQGVLSREQLKKELMAYDPTLDASKVGYHLTTISSQLGMKKNAFLRQVIGYEYPRYEWEKDNFTLREETRNIVEKVLEELKK